jgi:ferredoxin-NADP reductase
MSIARALADRDWKGTIHFLVVAKTFHDLIFRSELESLAANSPRFKLAITLTREAEGSDWAGELGRPTADLLKRFVPGVEKLPVYLCGPNEMMDATRELLRTVGVPDARIVTEAFAAKKKGRDAFSGEASHSSPAPEVNGHIDGSCAVRFARSGRQVDCDAETTILEAAESVEVPVSYECRSGICGQCTIRLLQGTVQMDRDDALNTTQKASGLILACQARARTAVAVDL